jgi:hypothetical protein
MMKFFEIVLDNMKVKVLQMKYFIENFCYGYYPKKSMGIFGLGTQRRGL